MTTEIMTLPIEVIEIAKNVSEEKRNEVQTVLNHVFNGVSKMRQQLDSINVINSNDNLSMSIAKTVRLSVRQVRLEAEKTFDAKRSEVQQQMLSYKTEDQLWLKAKQTMQILTKEIEENARWKEETKERFDAEQKELKIQQRMFKVSKVAPEMARSEFENMSDETFDIFYSGIEKAYNDKIEAEKKTEEERISKEKRRQKHINREFEVRDYGRFFDWDLSHEETTDEEFAMLIEKAKAAQKKDIDEKEAQKKENERLKAEIEAKEKQFAAEKAKAEAEEKARKEAEAKVIAEQKAKEAAEKKAKNAPDKTKLIELASQIDALNMPAIKGEDAQKILTDVKTLLSKVSVFIREKSNNL